MRANVRPPAVAGLFYPDDPARLAAQLRSLLPSAPAVGEAPRPKAIIVPHAGYLYSGPTAAAVYSRLEPWAGEIRRVVLLGPTHRVPVRGIAAPGADFFATPLGRVAIDREALAAIADLPQVGIADGVHAQEHSLEVQLPFLQAVLGDFSLLPLAVGEASAEEVAAVLERLWGGPETLLAVSSDLSHYLDYETAGRTDRATCERILGLDPQLSPAQACGARPLNGLLLAARRRHLRPELVDLRNSGDTAGDRSRVVGYAAFAFYPGEGHG